MDADGVAEDDKERRAKGATRVSMMMICDNEVRSPLRGMKSHFSGLRFGVFALHVEG